MIAPSINVNTASLSGIVLQDPHVRETRSGTPVVVFPLRHSYSYTKADGGSVDKSTTHTIVAFGRAANEITENVRCGQTVLVTGELRGFEDKKGKCVEGIVAKTVQIVYAPKESGGLF